MNELQSTPLQDVKCIAWHPSGEVLASASYDDTIRLWVNDGDEWSCAQTLGGLSIGGGLALALALGLGL